MSDPVTLVLATGNEGKLREFREALGARPLRIVSAREAGVEAFPPEDGDTYHANALVKAAHVASATGLPSLADDSGLEVDALGGAPGLHSARFGGALSDGERIAHLLARLRHVPDAERGATFVSVLVLATPEGEVRAFEGRCRGRILQGPRGDDGFGYEPVFFHEGLERTFAQVTREAKRRVSHRGRALEALGAWLDGAEGRAALARPPHGPRRAAEGGLSRRGPEGGDPPPDEG